ARKRRRLITLLSVGGLPPSWHPSGACLLRGPSVPVGLLTPPRVPPHRGDAFAERGAQPLERVRHHSALLLLLVAREPARPSPTCSRPVPAQWRRRPDGPVCGRLPGRPGPCDPGPPGMGLARRGHAAVLTPPPTGI